MRWLKFVILFVGALTLLVVTRQLVFPLLQVNNSLLQVETAGVKAQVYLDDKQIGESPLSVDRLAAGERQIRLEAVLDSPLSGQVVFSKKITLNAASLTAVNYQFGPNSLFSSGDISTKRTGNGLSIVTTPVGAKVSLNGEGVGKGPLSVSPSAGVHKLKVSHPSYYSRELEINVEPGKRLIVEVFLAANPFDQTKKLQDGRVVLYDLSTNRGELLSDFESWAKGVFFFEENAKLSFDLLIDKNGEEYFRSKQGWDKKTSQGKNVVVGYLGDKKDGGVTNQAQKTLSGFSEKPKPKEEKPIQKIQITPTPTGFLNIRGGPGTNYPILGKVNPGNTYNLLEEKPGWYKIKTSSTTGWVSTQYAKKI